MDVFGRGCALTPHAPRAHSMPQTVYAERETMISRGDLFSASLDPVVGSEQGGIRPVLVIQNDVGNRYSPTVIVLAITGLMGPVIGALIHNAGSVLVIVNSALLLRWKSKKLG